MRPPKCRYVEFDPNVTVFKPRGVPSTELSTIDLQIDELEAIRLADLEGLHQADAGTRMGVSRATFGRILERAHRKVADALIHGRALQFRGGEVLAARSMDYSCRKCRTDFSVPRETQLPVECPVCKSEKTTMAPR